MGLTATIAGHVALTVITAAPTAPTKRPITSIMSTGATQRVEAKRIKNEGKRHASIKIGI